jgi:hypothetical protein
MSEFTWTMDEYGVNNCMNEDFKVLAFLEQRPAYCDRGHWRVLCELPDIDEQDNFPRYYMSREVAIAETEAFLRWRMFKIRAERYHMRQPC